MFHVKHEAWVRMAREVGADLDDEALGRLDRYVGLLLDRAIPAGMVAPSDAERLFERHALDGLRAVPHLGAAASLIDAGSGAGIPGVPIAVARPDLPVTLVDPRRQRVAFLELVRDELALTALDVRQGRAQSVGIEADVVTARALGDAMATWEATSRLLRLGGRLIYWAGGTFDPGRDSPAGASVEVLPTSGVAMPGPLVIMTPL